MEEALVRRILPNSPEAEQSVIGAMLSSRDAIIAATEMISAEDFYNPRLGALFTTIVELFNEGVPADMITVPNRLKEKGLPQEYSSLEFISNLIRVTPTSANVRYYADIVATKATLRRLIKAAENIENACYLEKESLDSILDSSEKQVFDISQNRRVADFESLSSIVLKTLDSIEAASKIKGHVTGVETGFYELDYKTAGFQRSDLILLAARPAMGKTALALNIAEHVITKLKIPTAFFSLEMSKEQLAQRLLAMNSRVEAQSITTAQMDAGQWSALTESARKLSEGTLWIDDTPGISVSEVRSKCRKLKIERGLGLVIIDYLQLMQGSSHAESRQQEVAEISRSLKALAREMDCPVLALSQLSRAVEGRNDKRPMLSDLRESGSIEQDADLVMFIYRDDYYNHDSPDKGVAEVIIAKHRKGATGTVKLKSQLEYTRFSNLAKETDVQA